ncbi:Fructose-1,6-bisphosphatase class 1/Sedoheputulose-1,7-bisphosphatase [Corchorus olitorius]|uniref:fructose-bisphosphatase n=1 Tax=Corchorus olitorius TaxID=93759 RepID=A0A1R3L2B6_9ROSI|nr:Fructose-1,6-bisphosphatase class 1/Sedoheputulose-1,7-bisphosphatase [Corchorus olitorius]
MSNLTLAQYLQQKNGNLTPELAQVIETITNACKEIDQAIQKGALADLLGSAGNENVQGETQKKLDVLSNDLLLDALQAHPQVGGLASEELDDFTPVTQAADFMQPGTAQVAAGYVMYGPSTMMALTFGAGVDFFTFDIESREFILTTASVKVNADTQEFAINASNQRHWEAPVKRYIDELLAGKTSVRGKDFNMRWIACMVADVHRILCRTGIFMYPYDLKDPSSAGRLRLMYEANPMSFIIEQAGGAATTGRVRIMESSQTIFISAFLSLSAQKMKSIL